VTPPPHSPSREALPSLGDIYSRQAGITFGACQPKWPQMETGSSTGRMPHPRLTLVSPDL
jgi:hypothetical protein